MPAAEFGAASNYPERKGFPMLPIDAKRWRHRKHNNIRRSGEPIVPVRVRGA
jgi:hypothetical protein